MSNINPQSIDGTYPIAGQDNNSQGFRDNFTNTVNNFTFAAAELSDLQTKAVLKAALGSVGQTGTPTNDMNYAYLTHAQMIGAVETKKSIGNITYAASSFTVDWNQGHFQTVDLVGNTASLSFSSTWPATNLYTRLRLQCNTYTESCNLALPAAVATNISSIQGAMGQTINLPAGSVYVFEFATWDGGSTIAIQDVLRNYDIVANGASTTFTTVTAGRVNGGFVGNVGTVITGAGISGNTLNISGNIIGGLTQLAAINATPIGNTTPASGTFTTLSATGNVFSAAAHVETGYQQVKPTANVAVTVNHNVNRVLLHPTGTIVSFGANVTLPNVQVDGTIVNISSNVTIASLDVRSGWNGVVAVSPFGNATVTAGSNTRYMYIAADSTWYKIA